MRNEEHWWEPIRRAKAYRIFGYVDYLIIQVMMEVAWRGVCTLKTETICGDTGVHPGNVSRTLQLLERIGGVEVVVKGARGRKPEYRMTVPCPVKIGHELRRLSAAPKCARAHTVRTRKESPRIPYRRKPYVNSSSERGGTDTRDAATPALTNAQTAVADKLVKWGFNKGEAPKLVLEFGADQIGKWFDLATKAGAGGKGGYIRNCMKGQRGAAVAQANARQQADEDLEERRRRELRRQGERLTNAQREKLIVGELERMDAEALAALKDEAMEGIFSEKGKKRIASADVGGLAEFAMVRTIIARRLGMPD